MTPFFCGLIVGFLLGAFAFGVFVLVVLVKVHKRPAPPPTFHHRRWRSLPVVEVPPPWEREIEPVERCVRYEWINIAGESE